MKLELTKFESISQLRFQREPLNRLSPGVLGKEAEIVLAILLGKRHGHIGVLRQSVFVDTVFWEHGNADAGCRPALVTGQD